MEIDGRGYTLNCRSEVTLASVVEPILFSKERSLWQYSIADDEGNALDYTQTVGSVKGFGVVLNSAALLKAFRMLIRRRYCDGA